MNYKKPVVILNKHASSGKIFKKIAFYKKKITKFFGQNEVFYYLSESIEECENFVIRICKESLYDLIILIGGDGTLSSVSNALMKVDIHQRIPLLPVPGGTGNSLLKDFKINNINDALRKLNSGTNSFIDVLYVKTKEHQFYCVNLLGMGFISDVVKSAVESKRFLGSISYFLSSLFALKAFRPYVTTLRYGENQVFSSERVFFLTVSNNMYTGSSFKVAPKALLNDGVMDIIILHTINRFQFIKGFLRIFTGDHVKERGCTYIRTNHAVIEATPDFALMPDGELYDSSPVEITVVPLQIPVAFML